MMKRLGILNVWDCESSKTFWKLPVNVLTTSRLQPRRLWGIQRSALKRKIALYKQHAIQPYLDHGYFVRAYKRGVVDQAIEAGAALGFSVMEFMNTFGDVPESQLKRMAQASNRLRYELDL